MSPRIHAEAAMRAWQLEQVPPHFPGPAIGCYAPARTLDEVILRACEDTAQEERALYSALLDRCRRLIAAARNRRSTPAPTWDLRGTVAPPLSEELLATVDLGPLARSLEAVEKRAALGEVGPARDMVSEVAARAKAEGLSYRLAHEAVRADELEEEGESLARMLEADEAIGSGGDASRRIRQHYAAKRGKR